MSRIHERFKRERLFIPLKDCELAQVEGCIAWIRYSSHFKSLRLNMGYKGDLVMVEEDERMLRKVCWKVTRFLMFHFLMNHSGRINSLTWSCGVGFLKAGMTTVTIPPLIVEGKLNVRVRYKLKPGD